ncbi:hydroxyisourate hydrolase [Paremcibacter congregatus]|uniref:hydroxyisourate hydrolase n=1 Tax=Paremcibacter congregatus TaxID=2043170 RepID=UPI0030ECCF06|tara:strand:- start:3014 stop:3358 length:345 start_codon:yes stop_codon:yes gene_type:complete
MGHRGKITTHVLDTASGKPAAGIRIRMTRLADQQCLADVITNADGRCAAPLLSGDQMQAGRYRLDFHVGDYFSSPDEVAFLDVVPVDFGVTDSDAHYHIPLLISPYGYSTYRGS